MSGDVDNNYGIEVEDGDNCDIGCGGGAGGVGGGSGAAVANDNKQLENSKMKIQVYFLQHGDRKTTNNLSICKASNIKI